MEKKNARCDPLLREKGIVKGQHNPVLRRKDPMRSRRRWRFAKKEEVEAAWRSSPSPPQLLHSFRTLRTDRLVRISPNSRYANLFILKKFFPISHFSFWFSLDLQFSAVSLFLREQKKILYLAIHYRAPRVDESAAGFIHEHTTPLSFPLRSSTICSVFSSSFLVFPFCLSRLEKKTGVFFSSSSTWSVASLIMTVIIFSPG